MKLSDVKIDSSGLKKMEQEVLKKENYNPACFLIFYWKERMKGKIEKSLKESSKLPYGYVGDGWPYRIGRQSFALEKDVLGVRYAYDEEDWHYRDVGDSIYQVNLLSKVLKDAGITNPVVVDIGVGFGENSAWFSKIEIKND